MKQVVRLALTLLTIAAALGTTRVVSAAEIGPDGTPQVDVETEALRYGEASTPQLLTHYWIVMYGVDNFPYDPAPDQAKETELRKRILDLRLIMDFNAYVYEPGIFEAYRDAIDDSYEQVGRYKDLFDVQELDGLPISPVVQGERLAKMNVALAPFRLGSFREDLKTFFYTRSDGPRELEFRNQPRLWQIAQVAPSEQLDSAGNAAMLGASVLRNLRGQGLLVADIVDEQQEARFHDVRKALRSVLVLSDMFPSLTSGIGEAREPLAKVVKAYGKVNDQFVAYHEAQSSGRALDERAAELRDAYAKTQKTVGEFVESGQLDAYVAQLESVQQMHRR